MAGVTVQLLSAQKCPHQPGALGRWGLGAPGEKMKDFIWSLARLFVYHKWIKNVNNLREMLPFTSLAESLTIKIH